MLLEISTTKSTKRLKAEICRRLGLCRTQGAEAFALEGLGLCSFELRRARRSRRLLLCFLGRGFEGLRGCLFRAVGLAQVSWEGRESGFSVYDNSA